MIRYSLYDIPLFQEFLHHLPIGLTMYVLLYHYHSQTLRVVRLDDTLPRDLVAFFIYFFQFQGTVIMPYIIVHSLCF